MALEMRKEKYVLCLDRQPGGTLRVELRHPQKGRYFSFPAGVRLEYDGKICDCTFTQCQRKDDRLVFSLQAPSPEIAHAELTFVLGEDDIEVAFAATSSAELAVDSVELFREGSRGLYMVDCIRYFAPAPRNYQGINRAFHKSFCDCSMDGYFTPPPLNFSIGNQCGWVSFGLLDLPNSFHYQLSSRLGILVERPAGQIQTPAGAVYQAPRLLLTFPEDEWQGEALFRQKLVDKGLLTDTLPQKDNFPDWWQRPFVVTYGDQMLELQYNWYTDDDWGAPGYTQEWLSRWLDRAEKRLDSQNFTVMVDAFWQHRYSAQPKPDTQRFPNLRSFIDECHRRGHKVLLWTAPLIDNVGNGFVPLSQEMGVLSQDIVPGLDDGCRYIDFTSDRIVCYFDRISRLFFGDGKGELDCDGLKMDFLAYTQPPEKSRFQHPENGIGVKGIYRFYSLLDQAARKVKPDVLLNGSACDPRFDEVLHMNRLHDIQNVYEERETRARASVLAAPGMLVDSDGAIMLSSWVEETYLNAVIYSTPSLYYVNKFHDGISLSDEKMAALGRLLSLSARKPWGAVRFLSPGNWRLEREGRTLAASFDGHTLLLADRDGHSLHLFSWRDGMQTLPLFGMRPASLPEGFALTGDCLVGPLVSGRVFTLPLQQP